MSQVISVSLKDENLEFVDNFTPKKSRSSLINEAIERLKKDQLRRDLESYYSAPLVDSDTVWLTDEFDEWPVS